MDALQTVLIVIVLTLVKGNSCTFIEIPPTNTSVILGHTGLFQCKIAAQTPSVPVLWKTIDLAHIHGVDTLSYDNLTFNGDKHLIRNTYDLVILDVELKDEGQYVCDDNEGDTAGAYLSVNVPMQSMAVTVGTSGEVGPNSHINMTCRSINSRPAAELRWYKGVHDITNTVGHMEKIIRADGYGDTVSILSVYIAAGEMDIPYRCVADLPGKMAYRTEFLFPSMINAGASLSWFGGAIVFITLLSKFLT